MATDTRASTGRLGEDATLRLYRGMGYRAIARNWRCSLGELDLVVERGGVLAFCEVKTKTGWAFGAGFESVTAVKQRKVRALAHVFLASARLTPAGVRFDVASAYRTMNGRVSVELFEDAF